jgi:uncharacterized membrane protein YphA (DoxX/SURF4 family)
MVINISTFVQIISSTKKAMESLIQHHEAVAVFIARVFLGLLFFFQGYDAVFHVKVKYVIQTYENSFVNKGIPRFLTVCGAWFTSCVELIGGLFLIAGVFEYAVLYLLGIDLIIASIAFGITTPMWDMRFVFPRLALLLFLLITPSAWHLWCMDRLF